jgi:hypothetical protein
LVAHGRAPIRSDDRVTADRPSAKAATAAAALGGGIGRNGTQYESASTKN